MENSDLGSRTKNYFAVIESSPSIETTLSSQVHQQLLVWGFQILRAPPKEGNLPYVRLSQDDVTLQMPSGLTLSLDFQDHKYQRQFQPSKELLCRACGWHLGLRSVWDLTAGLGVDAMMLAQAGFAVRAFERNAFLVLMLQHAQKKLSENSTPASSYLSKLSFELAESEKIFETDENLPEVIYYDPMYPATKKKALPSKEMQILRELHGGEGENRTFVERLLHAGVKRVVVKRPHRAPPIVPKPRSVIEGKLVRFDIY